MRKIIVANNLTLDGVMQSPGGPDEDPSNGFTHGGWAAPRVDDVLVGKMGESMAHERRPAVRPSHLRALRELLAAPDRRNPFTEALNRREKYVASTTLKEPLPWENSTLLERGRAAAVAALKQQQGKDVVILGSGAARAVADARTT